MSARSENQIQTIVKNTKRNSFGKMMAIGFSGTIGVPLENDFARQSNLIWAASSSFATLAQKNVFADQIGRYDYDRNNPDAVFTTNTFEIGF